MIRLQESFKKAGTSEFKKLGFDGLNKYRTRWGGDEPSVEKPSAPVAPSYGSTIQDYIEQYPKLFDLLKTYAPQEAQLSQSIQQQLYPTTSALQENLAGMAQTGMTQDAPAWYNQNIRDSLKSQFGRNLVYNPQAQEQYGLATNQANEEWKRYYQNMGMSLTGRQPLVQPTNNITSSYAPNAATSYAGNVYGTQAGMYGQNLNAYMNPVSNPWMNIAGSIAGGIGGGIGTGLGYGMMGGFKRG